MSRQPAIPHPNAGCLHSKWPVFSPTGYVTTLSDKHPDVVVEFSPKNNPSP